MDAGDGRRRRRSGRRPPYLRRKMQKPTTFLPRAARDPARRPTDVEMRAVPQDKRKLRSHGRRSCTSLATLILYVAFCSPLLSLFLFYNTMYR